MSNYADQVQDGIDARFEWLERRWGLRFSCYVSWLWSEHDDWGLIKSEQVAALTFGLDLRPGETLDELARRQDAQVERTERLAQVALAHGF